MVLVEYNIRIRKKQIASLKWYSLKIDKKPSVMFREAIDDYLLKLAKSINTKE